MSKPQPVPQRPADDEDDPVTPEVERIVRERLADAGPTRPWDELFAEEKRRKPESPLPH